jgi:LPXTG-motif cell wall-anchored protein
MGGLGRALGGSPDGGLAGSGDGGLVEPPPIDTEDASSGGVSFKASAQGSASAACSCRVAGLEAGESGATAAGLLVFSGILALARRRRRRYPDA